MSGTKPNLKDRTLLENLLLAMGFGGIGLTAIVSLLVMASGLFFPDESAGLVLGFLIGVLGVTAGIGLIALSQVLGYLRVIASGMGPGKVFE